MEPIHKKAKITGHFRVALKPQDLNVQHHNKKLKSLPDSGKENNVEIITISDCEDEKQPKFKDECLSSNQPINRYHTPPGLHPNVVDHDRTLLFDITCEPHYAWDSFNYDREQEIKFRNRKYLDDLHHDHKITPIIRARLVDWLVQVQDTFSLYHETLYMAVKLADQYLMKKTVSRSRLQLLYMTTIFISAKFDERLPPIEISDLINQSGDVYNREQIIRFEVDILTTLNFNIRFPLSYGFLRRFVRCTRSDQKTLTLARYILESSLLEYEMIEILESELAAASLLLAFKLLHLEDAWDDTAIFYTQYTQQELYSTLIQLNQIISRPADRKLSTIRNKYSHEVFMSVARIRPLAKCPPPASYK